jgi:CRP-like cAMP-binding protein
MNVSLNIVQKSGQIIKRSTGKVIFREGDTSREMYVVISGRISIYLESEGKRIQLALFSAGDFFGEMSLLEGMPRSGTAVVEEDSELVVLTEASFLKLMKDDNELPWKVMKGLSMRIRNQNQALAQRIGKDLQDVAEKLNVNSEGINEAIKDIALAAGEIEGNGKELARHIKEIEAISQEMGKSLNFIRQVAMQTKIFGLNASIEAARSGEHGRGMRVIAGEIRKLSELSQENAEAIFRLTDKISSKMDEVTSSSENTAAKSQAQTGAIGNMVTSVEEVNGLAKRLVQIAGSL